MNGDDSIKCPCSFQKDCPFNKRPLLRCLGRQKIKHRRRNIIDTESFWIFSRGNISNRNKCCSPAKKFSGANVSCLRKFNIEIFREQRSLILAKFRTFRMSVLKTDIKVATSPSLIFV